MACSPQPPKGVKKKVVIRVLSASECWKKRSIVNYSRGGNCRGFEKKSTWIIVLPSRRDCYIEKCYRFVLFGRRSNTVGTRRKRARTWAIADHASVTKRRRELVVSLLEKPVHPSVPIDSIDNRFFFPFCVRAATRKVLGYSCNGTSDLISL